MTTLATIFDDAFLREKERWGVIHSPLTSRYMAIQGTYTDYSDTRADCERFIQRRARAAAFAALREAIKETDEYGAVYRHFLASLAGDGDAGKGE